MSAVLEFLGVLLAFGACWVMGGIALFAPIGIGRSSAIPEKFFGWWVWGYWAAFWIGVLVHWMTS
ncbi:hypothetical protein [Actinomadura nitritigenes]|uniref:hypothetical protein n=1 Tax=Actinomadura nitritigenes TaxID=134602 RepID=UPI003D930AC5